MNGNINMEEENNEFFGMSPPSIGTSISVGSYNFGNYLRASDMDMDIDMDTKQLTKMELVKNTLCNFCCTVENGFPSCEVILYPFDDDISTITGTPLELQEKINLWKPRGGTDFIKMAKLAKEIREKTKTDEEFRHVLIKLSDGFHNTGGKIETILTDNSFESIFDFACCIGTESTVDRTSAKFLAKDDQVSNETEETENMIIGSCFEGLISSNNMSDITFEFIFENNSEVCLLGEEGREEMDEKDLTDYLNSVDRTSDNLSKVTGSVTCTELSNNHFTLCSTKHTIDSTEFKDMKVKIHFFSDISFSMNENVGSNTYNIIRSNLLPISEEESESTEDILMKPYIKVTIKFSSFNQNLAVIMRGNLKCATVRYLDKNTEHFEVVKGFNSDITKTDDESYMTESNPIIEKYMELITGLKEIDNIPKHRSNFDLIKESIKTLHHDNIGFMTEIDDKIREDNHIELQIVNQCKAIWRRIVNRYKATLSKGEQWIESGRNLNPSVMCREVSCQLSSEISRSSGPLFSGPSCSTTNGLCKYCYENPVNMIFTDCKHAVACTACVTTDININNITIYRCPICRTPTSSFIEIEEVLPPLCQECNKTVSYYGVCKHPISCRKCAKTKKNKLHCNLCDKDVLYIKVYTV